MHERTVDSAEAAMRALILVRGAAATLAEYSYCRLCPSHQHAPQSYQVCMMAVAGRGGGSCCLAQQGCKAESEAGG